MKKIVLTEEQTLLQDSAKRYLADKYSFLERNRIVASTEGRDAAKWNDFAQMGWLGLPFADDLGGGEGTVFDLMLLTEAMGRSLVVEPFLSTILGGMTVASAGSSEQRKRFIPELIAGKLQLAIACHEPQNGYDLFDVVTQCARGGDGYKLNGHKAVVFGAPSADYLIVSARAGAVKGDAQRERNGLSLFLVPRTAPGVALRSYPTIDGRRAAEVLLKDVAVPSSALLGSAGEAAATLDELQLNACVALMGEAVGCLDGAVERTAAYHNEREQFGRKLATFQALRHRVADMAVAAEEMRALALLAGQSVASGDAGRAAAVSAAKAFAGTEGRRVCEDAVQLHGAIAITDEYVVGHYLKRMVTIDRLFGDSDFHLQQYMRCRGNFDEHAD